MGDTIFNLATDSTLYKLNELILNNCVPFNCGVDDLNDFFANDSIAYERDLMGKTYCWLDNSDDRKIVALITLANAGIQTTHLPNNPKRHLNKAIAYEKQGRTYPAVLIGRLGVDIDYQGAHFRIGAQIMDFIKKWFISDSNKTGCRFILVDASNNPHTLKYYERNGFKPLFPRSSDEKSFYDISETEELRTRMYYFDLLTY
ncbi:MAG: GNAT family N-acetyltransferase [Muribaculaceae bacterium]|nr:GNAT family N-acetyltransferase [Muribaculaceae bacterium]